MLRVNPQSQVSFNILYEETPDGIDLRQEKFLNQAQVSLDLEAEDLIVEITSSNYPDLYPNSADITWLIKVPDNFLVSLTVIDLEIEECCDRLIVYDGQNTQSSVLGELTGTTVPNNAIESSSNFLFLRFSSDCSLSQRGFKAIARAVSDNRESSASGETPTSSLPNNGSETCNAMKYLYAYPSNNHRLTSPGYPWYANNVYCEWRLQSVYSYYIVQLVVIDIQLETCCDFVDVYDGSSSYYPRLARLTNQSQIVYSSGMNMYIRFTTDGSGTSKGFNLQYTAATQHLATTSASLKTLVAYSFTSSYLSSPGYPYSYDNSQTCDWRITSDYSNNVVQLEILDIDLEACCDYVDVYDGSSSDYPRLVRLTNQNETVYSTGKYMYLQWRTDSSITRKGFRFRYSATTSPLANNDTACSSHGSHIYLLAGSVGNISSPNYPKFYHPNSNCSWFFQGQHSSYAVRLQSMEFALNDGDRVTVYDGSSSNYPVIRTLTGIWSGLTVESTGRNMFINFITDSSYESRGFNFQYESVLLSSVSVKEKTVSSHASCPDGTPHLESQQAYELYVESPGYPNQYGTNLDCDWIIHNSYSDNIIQVTVTSTTEYGKDFLRIYDGSSSSSTLIAIHTGTSQGSNYYYSSGDYMYLTFTSNDVTTSFDQGFRFVYRSYSKSDLATTSVPADVVTLVPNQATCPQGTQHLESQQGYRSFIQSPGYPNKYGINLDCHWVIHSRYNNYVIQLTILYLNTEYRNDYLQIYDGSSDSSRLIAIHTGSSQGIYYAYHSTGNYMYLTFTSNDITTSSDHGFNLAYKSSNKFKTSGSLAHDIEANEKQAVPDVTSPVYTTTPATPPTNGNYSCNGGVLYASTSYVYTFSSPGYSDNHPAYLDCNWKISTYSNYHIIQLSIVDIDLYHSGDYIRVYDGPDSSSPLLLESNSNSQRIVYSTGTQMVVNFKTAHYSSKKGFQASYAALYRVNCKNVVQHKARSAPNMLN